MSRISRLPLPKPKAKRVTRATKPAPAPDAAAGDIRQRILGAAIGLFMERGYRDTSTLAIATRAKVSKREVYAAFGSKDAMLVACIAHGVQQIRLPLEIPSARDRASLIAMLEAFGANFLRVILSPRVVTFYRLALAEAERAPEVAEMLDAAGRGGARAALAASIGEAQAAGLIGGSDAMTVTTRFFNLLLGELHLRRLLGVLAMPSDAYIEQRAHDATAATLTLYPPRE